MSPAFRVPPSPILRDIGARQPCEECPGIRRAHAPDGGGGEILPRTPQIASAERRNGGCDASRQTNSIDRPASRSRAATCVLRDRKPLCLCTGLRLCGLLRLRLLREQFRRPLPPSPLLLP